MSTLTYLDAPSNVVMFFGDPTKNIEAALRDFCGRKGIPDDITDKAIGIAIEHHDRDNSVASSIQHGKGHVWLWLAMNPQPPKVA